MRKDLENRTRSSIYGVGDQFMDDFMGIIDKFQNDPFVTKDFPRAFVSKICLPFIKVFISLFS